MRNVVEDIPYDRARAPVALVFGDDAVGRGRIARAAATAGVEIAVSVAVVDAAARLDARATADIVVVAPGRGGVAADALLDRIAADVAASRYAALLLVDLATVERFGALATGAGVECLVDWREEEVAAAFDRLTAPAVSAVGEEREEALRRRLAALGEEVARIARALSSPPVVAVAGEDGAVAAPAAERDFLRAQIRMRRQRERFFDRSLFADPAWDILLDLRLAAIERRSVAVSSLCIAASVPPTTGLRWIALMTERGLLERIADPDDGRRVFVALTPAATQAMERYAAAAIAAGKAA